MDDNFQAMSSVKIKFFVWWQWQCPTDCSAKYCNIFYFKCKCRKPRHVTPLQLIAPPIQFWISFNSFSTPYYSPHPKFLISIICLLCFSDLITSFFNNSISTPCCSPFKDLEIFAAFRGGNKVWFMVLEYYYYNF